jgi:nitroreductase
LKLEALDVMKHRRSIRRYKPEQITDRELELVLEAGTYAPTAKNLQSPIILVIQDPVLHREVTELNKKVSSPVMTANPNYDPYYGAPTILLILAKADTPEPVLDGAAVATNLLNAAYAVGLGSCWINRCQLMFACDEGKALLHRLGITGDYIGVASIALGYAAVDTPEPPPRKESYIYRF